MSNIIQRICGAKRTHDKLSLMQQTLNVIQGKSIDQEKLFFTLQTKIDTLSTEIEKQKKEYKELVQVLRGDIYQVQRHFSKLDETMKKSIVPSEENDIEKQSLDEGIEVTDDMRIPIVSGNNMKVRFETERLDTEIKIV